MKILNVKQIREADLYTIKHEPITSMKLMERAGEKCCEWLKDYITHQSNERQWHFKIFCGLGNNGGDGLVIARLLRKMNVKCSVFILNYSDKSSIDFTNNLKKLEKLDIKAHNLSSSNYNIEFSKEDVIVDAIFGSGLSKNISGWIKHIVSSINNSGNETISIDMPSGVFAENNTSNDMDSIVKANFTLTFQLPKLAMFLPDMASFFGEVFVLDIGLHHDFLDEAETDYYYTTPGMIYSLLQQRKKFSHKGTYGHSLLICGSRGKMGAGVLASKACLRIGSGLLTVNIPESGNSIMQTTIPEAMTITDEDQSKISTLIEIEKYSAIGIGPGLGTDDQTARVLKVLIQNSTKPMVIDADALNILSENKTWLSFLSPGTILTPHPKEFERLTESWSTDFERLKLQRDLSIKLGIYVVLKGAHTAISCPDGKIYFNNSGNPGMATAGSGDVLTGIITGLLAQNYSPEKSSVLGVYLHGLAGDLYAQEKAPESLIASDIIDHIAAAYAEIRNKQL